MVVNGVEDTGRVDETLSCHDFAGHSGLREHADRGGCVCHGRHLLRGPRRLHSSLYSGDTCFLSSSWDGARSRCTTDCCESFKMWSSSAEKGKPKRKQPGEGGRAPEAPQKSPPRLKTRFSLLCVHLCVVLPHRESCKLSAGSQSTFSRPGPDPLPEELQGRGLPGDLQSQFWGWCPLDLKSTAPVRTPTGRILRRSSPVDTPRPRTPRNVPE